MNISARSILNIDTISKGNDKPWDKLIAYMEGQPKGTPIEFDFRGIEVIQPCNSNSFMKLLSNPDFRMVMYNSEETVKSIQLMCILNNQDKSRIVNIKDEMPKVLTPEEKTIQRMADQLMAYFKTNDEGTVGILPVNERFDQIGNPNTVKYIVAAVEKYVESTGIKEVYVNTAMISIQSSVIDALAEMVESMRKQGVNLTVTSDDREIQNKIEMSLDLSKANYSSADKFQIMQNRLVPGRVGILTKYKEGKARDEFGRQGKGEKALVRVAIFLGFSTKDGQNMAKFRTYNGNKFYTKAHWYLEKDCEELTKLEYDDIVVSADELGIYSDFIGSKYHFSTPVQYDAKSTITMYSTTETGNVVGTPMTIPERAMAVLDDFGVDYDRENLMQAIDKTYEILGI